MPSGPPQRPHDNVVLAEMELATFLPSETGPYLVLLGIGFLVGGYGHLAHFRWLVLAGIMIILSTVIAFQVAIQVLPSPPGF